MRGWSRRLIALNAAVASGAMAGLAVVLGAGSLVSLGLLGGAGLAAMVACSLAPAVGTTLLVVALPFHPVFKQFSGSELVGTYWKEGLLALLAGALILHRMAGFRRTVLWRRLRRSGVLMPLMIYFGIVFLRFVVGPDRSMGAWGLYFYFTYFVLFLVVVYFFERDEVNALSQVLIVLGGAIGSLVVLDALIDLSDFHDAAEASWYMQEFGFRRARFPFASPLIASAFLSGTAVLAIQAVLSPARMLPLAVVVTALLGNLAGLIATFSRGGWVSLLASIGVIVALQKYPRVRLPSARSMVLLVGVGASATVVLIFTGFADLVVERLVSIVDLSEVGTAERLLRWGYAFERFTEAPIFGIGIGVTGARAIGLSSEAFNTESYILQHMVEMGLLGLVAYLFLVGSFLRLGLQNLRRLAPSAARDQTLAATAILASLFVYSTYLQVLQAREIALLFWLCGAFLVVASDDQPAVEPQPEL